jgi:hypothetical protein
MHGKSIVDIEIIAILAFIGVVASVVFANLKRAPFESARMRMLATLAGLLALVFIVWGVLNEFAKNFPFG